MMVPGVEVAESGLKDCKAWTDVCRVLGRAEDRISTSIGDLAISVELWVFTVKNAVLWGFHTSPPSLNVPQALALLHSVIRKLHHTQVDGLAIAESQCSNYYVSAFDKVFTIFPTRAMGNFGLTLAYCYLHENMLEDAQATADILSSHEASKHNRLLVLASAWIALKRRQADVAASILDKKDIPSSAHAFWLAFARIQEHRSRKSFTSCSLMWELLQKAIAGDVQPVVSLNLHAWFIMQAANASIGLDAVTAGDSLARAMEMDFDQVLSLFNYAMLLGRQKKWPELQQMLQYCLDAVATLPQLTEGISVAMNAQETVSSTIIQAYLARACLRTYNFDTARTLFHRILVTTGDVPSSLGPFESSVLIRDHVFALLEADAPQSALDVANAALQRTQPDPKLLLYKADALLCLEQLQECEWTMQQLDTLLSAQDEPDQDQHVQLLNNHALALACQGHTDAAVQKLSECRRRYPSCLHAAFNLTVLLWRENKRDAACALWLEARPSPSKVDESINRHSQSSSSHVASRRDGGVALKQIAALNRLIESYWSDKQRIQAIKQTLRVVEHTVQSVMADAESPVKPPRQPSPKRSPSNEAGGQHHHRRHQHHAPHGDPNVAQAPSYWNQWLTRAGAVSLLFSLLMQLSYVAFPAYNFSLAIWATVHPVSSHHHTKTTVLFISILLLSCVTDVVWSSLWVSGSVFYDMLCQPARIGILQCDGLQSFPGCATNRFVMVLFVTNIALKMWIALSIWKAVAVADKKPDVVQAIEVAQPPGDTVVIQDVPTPTAIPIE
ncbi:hypothetical protein AeRB84_000661 [Aphanomyces euteiches]|nr:hypothetical protein AeRB84_000661 [Aphanomyces euteiches]